MQTQLPDQAQVFQTEQSKVNYSLSFPKGTSLDYFEPYLTDDTANEPAWLNNYELFVEELLINFSPYDMMADAEVELEQLIMKDNHKATKFLLISTDLPCSPNEDQGWNGTFCQTSLAWQTPGPCSEIWPMLLGMKR